MRKSGRKRVRCGAEASRRRSKRNPASVIIITFVDSARETRIAPQWEGFPTTQQKETLGQLELKRLALQDAESLGIQGSHAASVLLDRSKPENTPLADDSEIVSIREIGNVKPQSPQAPSCLELFQW